MAQTPCLFALCAWKCHVVFDCASVGETSSCCLLLCEQVLAAAQQRHDEIAALRVRASLSVTRQSGPSVVTRALVAWSCRPVLARGEGLRTEGPAFRSLCDAVVACRLMMGCPHRLCRAATSLIEKLALAARG
jgi:hypothetical protein